MKNMVLAIIAVILIVAVSMLAVTNIDVRKALGIDKLLGSEPQPISAATVSFEVVEGEVNEK